MNEKKIVWESLHIPRGEERRDAREQFLDGFDKDDLDDEDSEVYQEIQDMPTVIDTPVGFFLKEDINNPLSRIEHRYCLTNFTITKKIAVVTNFIEGVETLAVISRYQMIVGFGRLFDASAVRKQIEQTLYNIDDYPEDLFEEQLLIIESELE